MKTELTAAWFVHAQAFPGVHGIDVDVKDEKPPALPAARATSKPRSMLPTVSTPPAESQPFVPPCATANGKRLANS